MSARTTGLLDMEKAEWLLIGRGRDTCMDVGKACEQLAETLVDFLKLSVFPPK